MIVDLLATAAFGKNQEVQSICCTLFSEEELVEIISKKEISIYCKRPFMKFLVSVYMEENQKRRTHYLGNQYVLALFAFNVHHSQSSPFPCNNFKIIFPIISMVGAIIMNL